MPENKHYHYYYFKYFTRILISSEENHCIYYKSFALFHAGNSSRKTFLQMNLPAPKLWEQQVSPTYKRFHCILFEWFCRSIQSSQVISPITVEYVWRHLYHVICHSQSTMSKPRNTLNPTSILPGYFRLDCDFKALSSLQRYIPTILWNLMSWWR